MEHAYKKVFIKLMKMVYIMLMTSRGERLTLWVGSLCFSYEEERWWNQGINVLLVVRILALLQIVARMKHQNTTLSTQVISFIV